MAALPFSGSDTKISLPFTVRPYISAVMKYPTGPQGEQLKGIRKTIEEALGKLENVTPEMAEKTVRDLLPSSSNDVSSLVHFTGYYGINGINTSAGAFFSIDTTEICITWPITREVTVHFRIPLITISVSLNGTASTSYLFDNSSSFDGQTLIIPNALQVSLTRGYQSGQLVTLSGTITGNTVSGSTYFNPVPMRVFAGSYKTTKAGPTKLTVAADSSLAFDFGDRLRNIPVFTYDRAMYVVLFDHGDVRYTLMLGTDAGGGLACFITDGKSNEVTFTIPSS
jgi:hypothetical protein